MSPTPPPKANNPNPLDVTLPKAKDPVKLDDAKTIIKGWKKIRDLMASPKERARIVKHWKGASKTKRALRLRRVWEGIPEKHHPDFEGIFSWRPHGHTPSLDELKKPTLSESKDWEGHLDRAKTLWSTYNVEDLSAYPGPLLEMLYTRALTIPANYWDPDLDAPHADFKAHFWPDHDPDNTENDWVVMDDGDNGYLTYGDVRTATTKEEWGQYQMEGLAILGVAKLGLEVQAKLYTFLADMCREALGHKDYNNAPELADNAERDFGDNAAWRPQAPDENAPDDEAGLQAYFDECSKLQPFTSQTDIKWEFLKRLADAERMKARKVLLGMREDPRVFRDTLEAAMERQPVEMESFYLEMDERKGKHAHVNRATREVLGKFEFETGHREIRKLRDSIVTAVNLYECWSHIFRLIVRIGSRWEFYETSRVDEGHLHREFLVDLKTLYRLLEMLESGLEPRNCSDKYIFAAEKPFQKYFSRVVEHCRETERGLLIERACVLGNWPPGEDTAARNLVEMMARIEAFNPPLGAFNGPMKLIADELLQCSEDTGLGLSPFARQHCEQLRARDNIDAEFQSYSWLNPFFNSIVSHPGYLDT